MKRACVASLLIPVMLLTGCFLSSPWFIKVKDVVAVIAPAAINVVTLYANLEGTPVNQAYVDKINTDTANVLKLLNDYQAASATAAPAVLAQVSAAASTTQTDLTMILSFLQVSNKDKQTKITAVVNFVLSEVAALQLIIPAAQGNAVAARKLKTAPPLSAKAFKKAFNAHMRVKTGDTQADNAAAKLVLK